VSVLFLNSWKVSNRIVRYDTNPDKNNIDTQGKLRLNLVSDLLEYRGKSQKYFKISLCYTDLTKKTDWPRFGAFYTFHKAIILLAWIVFKFKL
jgi:hypothetical protein